MARAMRYLVLIALQLLIAAAPALGQGFMVKPMKVETSARAGEQLQIAVELRNTAGQQGRTIDAKVVSLTQGSNGGWSVVQGQDPNALLDASAAAWMTLASSTIQVPPLEMRELELTVSVPAEARGYYVGGILVQSRAEPGTEGIQLRMAFVVPVVIEISGRPVRQQIELASVSMQSIDGLQQVTPGLIPEPSKSTTTVSMEIANRGRTYSKLSGGVRVDYQAGDRWQAVARADLPERSIMPGIRLTLPFDLQRRLPSGKYRLRGLLNVDGRPIAPLEQEIDFKGDPNAMAVVPDASLGLEPKDLVLEGVPGATRTATFEVVNGSSDAVQIEASAQTPAGLVGVMLGDLRGDQLSAAEWLQVSPAKFVLQGGARQKVRVMARFPRDGMDRASYYGVLSLKSSYTDGQSAGSTTANVTVTNARVEAHPKAQVDRASLAADSESRYIIQSRISNVGDVHFSPRLRATLLTGRGDAVTEVGLDGETASMLPFAVRDFGGVMDFANVEEGNYLLRVNLEYGEKPAVSAGIPLSVGTEEGRKVVTVLKEEATNAPAKE